MFTDDLFDSFKVYYLLSLLLFQIHTLCQCQKKFYLQNLKRFAQQPMYFKSFFVQLRIAQLLMGALTSKLKVETLRLTLRQN